MYYTAIIVETMYRLKIPNNYILWLCTIRKHSSLFVTSYPMNISICVEMFYIMNILSPNLPRTWIEDNKYLIVSCSFLLLAIQLIVNKINGWHDRSVNNFPEKKLWNPLVTKQRVMDIA